MQLGLNQEEVEYVTLSMYRASRDIYHLPTGEMGKLFKQLGLSAKETNEEQPIKSAGDENKEEAEIAEEVEGKKEEEEEVKEGQEKNEDDYEPEFEGDANKKKHIPVSQSVPDEKSNNALEPKEESIGEDQIIEIAQKCFGEIAETMHTKGITVRKLFGDATYKEQTEEGEEELINSADFIKILHELGIEINEVAEHCLLKVLAATSEEKFIRIADFVQVMDDYGALEKTKEEEGKEHNFPMNLNELDKVSMVIMLALSEYLKKEKLVAQDLFASAVYKQLVKTRTQQKSVDLINSADFFKVLHDIGIKTEDTEHENLKLFLCLDASYPDKLQVKKLA